ncbi:MAG: MFS transporter [bacterium]|jgi:DHA2 family methylenomycin A resistance protein-like MFS transporter|nr:MFS transporter [bacterium]
MPNSEEQAASGQQLWSLALVAVCLGYFMVILDTTVVNVALPALGRDLHAGVSGLQWVVDGYLLMLAALILSGGVLADRAGARRIFQIGLGLFVVASAVCGLAQDVVVLVAARLIQGAGASLLVPASLSLLRAAFLDTGTRARAVGIWGSIAGIGAGAGPILGGLLVSAVSWRLVFFVNLPIGLGVMALTARHVPAPDPRPRHLDPIAQLLGVLALAALTIALIEGGSDGLTPLVLAAAAVFVIGAGAFVIIETKIPNPMLPLGLFANHAFLGGNVIGLLINLGFYGELFVINLYFQEILGYSALVAGLALLPQVGVLWAGSALSGRVTARAGSPRPTLLVGLVVGGAGLLALLVAGAHPHYLLLVVPLVAAGFGMSFTMPAATTAVVDGAPAERAGLASGAINAARQVGGVVGVALLGALVAGPRPGFMLGFHIAVVIAGLAFLTGAAIAAVTVPGREARA